LREDPLETTFTYANSQFQSFQPFKRFASFKPFKPNAGSKRSKVPVYSDRSITGNRTIAIAAPGDCDSEKIVFPESRGSKRKNESGGINWRCSDCGCTGFQSGCVVVVTSGGNNPEAFESLQN
jgi:hypothetical protein